MVGSIDPKEKENSREKERLHFLPLDVPDTQNILPKKKNLNPIKYAIKNPSFTTNY